MSDSNEVDTTNRWMVGVGAGDGGRVSIMMPPRGPMPKDEALVLAAWLVTLADPVGDRFKAILDKIQNS